MNASDLDALLAEAIALDEADGRYDEVIRELQARGDPVTFRACAELCRDASVKHRRVGLLILSQLGLRDGVRPFAAESLPIVVGSCGVGESVDVLEAAIRSVGELGLPEGLPVVLAHLTATDAIVRLRVAQSLPGIVGDPPAPEAIEALLVLMEDPNADVRDWATFGLGTMLAGEVDSDRIRDALRARLNDRDGHTRDEALAGLACRHDPAAPDMILARLQQDSVGWIAFRAAFWMPDPRYLPELLSWQEEFPELDLWGRTLAEAIEECQALD